MTSSFSDQDSERGIHSNAIQTCSHFFSHAAYAAIPLRAIAGGGFVQHGWAKIIKGPEAFAAILQSLHVPFPHLSAYLTISVELQGGAALLFGAFIAWASVPAVVVLLTAMFTVHLPYGFSSIKIKAIVDGRAQFGPPGTNATFSISRASWLSCSSTQARGPLIAIACGSATPEFPPSFPDDEEAS
jgi:putative oxidoreductase